MTPLIRRAEIFCDRFGLRAPILQAPMAGCCPPALAIAVGNAGGLGGCGALLMEPQAIRTWVHEVRSGGNGAFQLNIWIPDPSPARDPTHEAQVRDFLGTWGPAVAAEAGDTALPDFAAQVSAMVEAGPAIMSSIMGLYPPEMVLRMKARGIAWFANVTTVAEARAAAAAGADVIIAQGAEAGGHRGSFDAADAERRLVGLFALLPAVCDTVELPVVASGGIADARGVAAALALGASAVQVGTGFLRCPETKLAPAWADALAQTAPEDTIVTRAFSGRPRSQHRHRLCACGELCRRAVAGALPGAARPNRRHAQRRPGGGGSAAHAGLGRAVGSPRRSNARRGCGPGALGRRAGHSDADTLSGKSLPFFASAGQAAGVMQWSVR